MRIGVVAPSSPIGVETAEGVSAIAACLYPDVTIHFHPQCFIRHHHFAGADALRADALVEYANDPGLDAIWFARGGYGSCRIAQDALSRLNGPARDKSYLGYSDAGYLLGGLYAAGFSKLAHGPMPQDVTRDDGEAAIKRALDWLVRGSPEALEPNVGREKTAAFNILTFSQLLGTPLQPDLGGHVLMLEEVSEYMYRIDRSMFHISSNESVRRVAGIRLGRCSDVPENDPDFGESEEEVVRHWCDHAGIFYLGRADIGHDSGNRIVPFGGA